METGSRWWWWWWSVDLHLNLGLLCSQKVPTTGRSGWAENTRTALPQAEARPQCSMLCCPHWKYIPRIIIVGVSHLLWVLIPLFWSNIYLYHWLQTGGSTTPVGLEFSRSVNEENYHLEAWQPPAYHPTLSRLVASSQLALFLGISGWPHPPFIPFQSRWQIVILSSSLK